MPFATILRFFIDGTQRQILVVTRIESPACHIAYVDAGANPNPNELARSGRPSPQLHFDFNTRLERSSAASSATRPAPGVGTGGTPRPKLLVRAASAGRRIL